RGIAKNKGRSMEFFLFGLFRDEGRERPTGGLADYRQVKPWKKRGISRRIVRFALNFAKPLKHGREEEAEEGNCQQRRNCQKIQIADWMKQSVISIWILWQFGFLAILFRFCHKLACLNLSGSLYLHKDTIVTRLGKAIW